MPFKDELVQWRKKQEGTIGVIRISNQKVQGEHVHVIITIRRSLEAPLHDAKPLCLV